VYLLGALKALLFDNISTIKHVGSVKKFSVITQLANVGILATSVECSFLYSCDTILAVITHRYKHKSSAILWKLLYTLSITLLQL